MYLYIIYFYLKNDKFVKFIFKIILRYSQSEMGWVSPFTNSNDNDLEKKNQI